MVDLFAATFLTEMALPFLLIFVTVFAILEKSKILGDGKHKINALVGLVIGLLLIAFETPRDIVVEIMPWIAVGVAVLLIFLILYGFVAGDLSKGLPKQMKWVLTALISLFVVFVVVFVSGLDKIVGGWFGGVKDSFWINAFVLFLIVGSIFWVVFSGAEKKDKKKEE